jgi:hypothetical protein
MKAVTTTYQHRLAKETMVLLWGSAATSGFGSRGGGQKLSAAAAATKALF